MAWNGSGTFSRLYNWVSRAANPVTKYIDATTMDAEFDNYKSGLENCLTRTGETTPSANQPMSNYRHTSVGAATALTDYARAGEVQKGTIFKAASAAGTIDAMTATVTPAPALTAGQFVTIVVPDTGSNASTTPTLTLNGGSPVTIRKHQAALVAGDYSAGDSLMLLYDGTYFEIVNHKYPALNNPHSDFTTDSTGGAVADFLPFIDASDSNADNKVLVSDFFKNVFANVTADTSGGATADVLIFGDASESGEINSMTVDNLFTNVLANYSTKSAPILADSVMVKDSAASNVPKISTLQQVANGLSLTTAKTSLASGDKLYMGDSAASDVAKHITWANTETQLLTDLAATEAEQETGTSVLKFVTPGIFKKHHGSAKAWANWDGESAGITPRDSMDVTTVTDNGTGEYTCTRVTAFVAADYAYVMGGGDGTNSKFLSFQQQTSNPTTTAVRMSCYHINNSNTDCAQVNMVFFGEE